MAEDVDLDVKPQVSTVAVDKPQEIHYDKQVTNAVEELTGQLVLLSDYFKKDSSKSPTENIGIRSVDQALNKVNLPKYGLDKNTEPELRARIEAGIADHLYSVEKKGFKQWVINRAVENELYLYNDESGMSLLKTAAKLFPEVLEKYKKLQ